MFRTFGVEASRMTNVSNFWGEASRMTIVSDFWGKVINSTSKCVTVTKNNALAYVLVLGGRPGRHVQKLCPPRPKARFTSLRGRCVAPRDGGMGGTRVFLHTSGPCLPPGMVQCHSVRCMYLLGSASLAVFFCPCNLSNFPLAWATGVKIQDNFLSQGPAIELPLGISSWPGAALSKNG